MYTLYSSTAGNRGILATKRKAFLTEFLSALGAVEIQYSFESIDSIAGKVIYDHDKADESQDFCWHVTEEQVPSSNAFNLTQLLNREHLLNIDKIVVPQEELLWKLKTTYGTTLTHTQFQETLEELRTIQVAMVDDGEETDVYFIHW